MNDVALGFFIAAIGLCLGSYAGMLSYRLPRGEQTVAGHSRCPQCRSILTPSDMIPVISWLFYRGRCRHCGQSISWRYPVIEITVMMTSLAAWIVSGPTLDGVIIGILGLVLVISTVCDFEWQIIPNEMTAIVAGLGVIWVVGDGRPIYPAISGATLLFGLSWGVRWWYRWRTGVEGLGMGDIKLYAAGGLWVGIYGAPFLLITSSCVGLVLGVVWRLSGGQRQFPLGPAIAVTLYVQICCMTRGLTLF
ncbi:MAG: A24 family peptidase [Rhodospirillaceae bacterium]